MLSREQEPRMTTQFADLLSGATREVFETMSFLDVIQHPPVKDDSEIPGLDISAIVCLAGEISGLLAVHSSKDFAVRCCELISGEEIEPTDRHLRDMVGELANMIAGTLKRRMSSTLDLFDISIPSLIHGKGYTLVHGGAKEEFPRLVIPFATDDRVEFYVELLYHKL
jgi:chemotaxis protein CheX